MIHIMKASAGSGKTYNLAKKYIELLLTSEERYPYKHILAVTFTNKATEEMKSRIIKELDVLAKNTSKSPYYKDFLPLMKGDEAALKQKCEALLSDILHDYSAFSVSTIDKFFQQTLRAFSREIGHFAAYQVELDRESLISESVDRVLDSLTEGDMTLLPWLTSNALAQIEQGEKFSLDSDLQDFAKRLMHIERQVALQKVELPSDAYTQTHLDRIKTACESCISSFKTDVSSTAQDALDILSRAGLSVSDTYRGFMSSLEPYANHVDSIVRPTAAFLKRAVDPDGWFKKGCENLVSALMPDMLNVLTRFVDLFGLRYKEYRTALVILDEMYGMGVANVLIQSFKSLMKEKNVLCLDDSNEILRDIIGKTETPFIYEKMGVRYNHFLLDEFQDTSLIQWDNFRPLLENSEAQGYDNLVVGDVKQSIYRWRGASWNLLDSKVQSQFTSHKEIPLDTNYRSLKNIVDFNNAFFKEAAEILDAQKSYPGKSIASIYSDVHQNVADKSSEKGSVSLTFCPVEDEVGKVLEVIAELREKGARLSEIAVLVRKKAQGAQVANALIENHIPVVTDDSLKVKTSVFVRKLVAMMSCIDNPQNAISGYLAESMDMDMSSITYSSRSLVDLAENLIRLLKRNDKEGKWRGDVLHIQSFMDVLLQYIQLEGNNLHGFLDYWAGVNPDISSPSSGESVRIITIHKSKGLDFPYVIIPFVEKFDLYKVDHHWCVPDLANSSHMENVNGIYDIKLKKDVKDTLFADQYNEEVFQQCVEQLNSLYVGMTRPRLGLHMISAMPSDSALKTIGEGGVPNLSELSTLLYWFASNRMIDGLEERENRFDYGEQVDFNSLRGKEEYMAVFPVADSEEYPSFPLNDSDEVFSSDDELSVGERGRLKFSTDAVDFFKSDDEPGYDASNRLRGVVLHKILSGVNEEKDLEVSIQSCVNIGEITMDEASHIKTVLQKKLDSVRDRGWFGTDVELSYNEVTLIDVDGSVYRPDRVLVKDGRVQIIDYKFGEEYAKYKRQIMTYADLWRKMGYTDVDTYLWYVEQDRIV